MPDPSQTLATILTLIDQTPSSDRFAEILRHRLIPHVSFSQISAVEFCHRRYFLEYIALLDPTPIPDYFTKGKLLHQVIAADYIQRSDRNGASSPDDGFQTIDTAYPGDYHLTSRLHLRNAYTLHIQNRWQDCTVLAVEQPFAMLIAPDLPPVVGVIDLILHKDGRYILVDHKTGRDFYPADQLQMAIYVQYIQQRYGAAPCDFYYDHYRWVNNLARVRKPAFQRDRVSSAGEDWPAALERIRAGVEQIQGIKERKWGEKNGECFRCPYRKVCW